MEGKLVRLRGYEKSDLVSLMKWINDDEVTQFLAPGVLSWPVSSIAEERFIADAALAGPEAVNRSFVIETLANREYIGGIALHAINWIDRHAAVGIVIGDKSYWGRGYGTDAMRLLLRIGFDKLNLHRLWLRVYDFNLRAISSYEKCGFKREGVLREERFHKGAYHDTIVMGMIADEYRATNP